MNIFRNYRNAVFVATNVGRHAPGPTFPIIHEPDTGSVVLRQGVFYFRTNRSHEEILIDLDVVLGTNNTIAEHNDNTIIL